MPLRLLACLIACLSGCTDALVVAAPVSLSAPLGALLPGFEATHGKVVLHLGGSGALVRQVLDGAPADVVVSAHPRFLDALGHARRIDPATRLSFASNTLVLVGRGPPDDARRLLQSTDVRLATGDPALVPAGLCAREALERLGAWERLRRRTLLTANVRQALDLVSTGEAQLGIVYRTEVAADSALTVRAELPGASGCARYEAAVVSGSRRAGVARAFVTMLGSPVFQAELRRCGFLPP